jgi:pyrroline-5-carboxylate reductase
MVETSVIGCGNMGGAFVKGLSRNGEHSVTAYDVDASARESVAPYCQRTTADIEAAADSEVVVVAVKPGVVGEVLGELDLSPAQTLVTIAAGVPKEFVEERTDATVVRLMPNLAAETGDMAAAVSWDEPDEDVRRLLEDLGEFAAIDEELMDTATALNGSGPAFVFYLLRAMKEAGTEQGLSPDQAETLAAQTFKGAAETVLRSERSVDELIDAVCSPKGTTIEGIRVLRESTADAALEDALVAATERSRELAEEFDDG